MHPLLGFIDNPATLLILGAIAVMLFGERLPEIARKVGKGLSEVKKNVHGLRQELENAVNSTGINDAITKTTSTYGYESYESPEDREEATAPKFEPPPLSAELQQVGHSDHDKAVAESSRPDA